MHMIVESRLLRSCIGVTVFCTWLMASEMQAQTQSQASPGNCATVSLDDVTITCIRSRLGAFSPEDRAQVIETRLSKLADDFKFDTESLIVVDTEEGQQITANDLVVTSLRNVDVDIPQGDTLRHQVQLIADKMKLAIIDHRERTAPHTIIVGLTKTAIATLGLALVMWIFRRTFPFVYAKMLDSKDRWIRTINFQGFEIFNASRINSILTALTSLLRLFLTLIAFYIYFPLVFSFFPWTSSWAPRLYGYITHPLAKIATTIIDFIPNFFSSRLSFF